jgi:hypothetical protein
MCATQNQLNLSFGLALSAAGPRFGARWGAGKSQLGQSQTRWLSFARSFAFWGAMRMESKYLEKKLWNGYL